MEHIEKVSKTQCMDLNFLHLQSVNHVSDNIGSITLIVAAFHKGIGMVDSNLEYFKRPA